MMLHWCSSLVSALKHLPELMLHCWLKTCEDLCEKISRQATGAFGAIVARISTLSPPPPVELLYRSLFTCTQSTWHRRLGHLGEAFINFFVFLVVQLLVLKRKYIVVCVMCVSWVSILHCPLILQIPLKTVLLM